MDIVVPSPGESITEVTLGQWHRQDGDWVETDEILVDIESDKATLEVRAPAAGVLHVKAKAGAEQKVGAAIASIDTSAAKPAGGGAAKAASGAPAAAPVAAPAASAAAATEAKPEGGRKASSLARQVAADKGVDLANVAGSGTAGRLVVADVERAATGVAAIANPVKPVAPAPAPLAVAGARGTRRERMPKIRQRIAERLVQAQHTAAMLTTFNECDMTEVMRLRAEHKESFEKHHGVGLGFMSFFVKACTSALQRFPKVNAYFMGEEVEHHDYCDVSIAVGTDRGLVVPVLRNAEAMSFAEIELAIRGFAARARDGKLSVDEMSGGTFTITNGGIYGSLMSTPILNPPQSAILGMHAIKKRPVEDPRNPGQVALRPMMYLALSYDHRIIDGAEAVSFLVHVKDCIEKPERLLLD
ncbi:MAG: 2-oxoglutarate dehydrogenase complex dihydrolipoyllysine-residue succinyltransferase, partial [Phycisphaerales bacterium]